MACEDVEGTYESVMLVVDGTGEVMTDPAMTFGPPDEQGLFEGSFQNEPSFRGQCSNDGRQAVITFRRLHTDGATVTVYRRGRVTVIEDEERVIIRGRFTRVSMGDGRDAATTIIMAGDWETERPT